MRKTAAILILLASLLADGCGGGGDAAFLPAEGAPETTVGASADGEVGATGAGNTISELPTRPLVIRTSGGEEVEVVAEIADDDAERRRGLMQRTELAESAGMLFVFGAEQPLSFWMKDTLIPLSIAYIAADGRIVDIQDMEPLDDEPPSYVSAEPAKYALEVNRGFFAERGVEVGDTVEIPEEYR